MLSSSISDRHKTRHFVKGHTRNIPNKITFKWFSGVIEELFQNISLRVLYCILKLSSCSGSHLDVNFFFRAASLKFLMNRKLHQIFKTTQEAFLLSWSVISSVLCKKNIKMLKANRYNWQMNAIYRLLRALFHIWTVIIPRDRFRPDGKYRSRNDNSGCGKKQALIYLSHIPTLN